MADTHFCSTGLGLLDNPPEHWTVQTMASQNNFLSEHRADNFVNIYNLQQSISIQLLKLYKQIKQIYYKTEDAKIHMKQT